VEEFGNLLSYYRGKSVDPNRGKPLTQERLAELLERVARVQYAGATISNWERGASRINANDRDILVGLIRVFYDCHALRSADEANLLLATGNYRHLNEAEMQQVFGNGRSSRHVWAGTAAAPAARNGSGVTSDQVLLESLKELLAHPIERLYFALRPEPAPAPQPTWSNVVETVLTKLFRYWTPASLLWAVAWITVWLSTWALTFPLLRWSGDNQYQLHRAAISYASGALFLPLLISLLVYQARNRNLWPEQSRGRVPLPFFTCLGAMAGFHMAYTLLFTGRLLAYHLDFAPATVRLELLAAALPVLLAFTAAQQLPFHFRRAFGTLEVTTGDQAIFTVLFLFAPFLAAALALAYHWLFLPHIMVPLVLATISLMALLARSKRRPGRTLLPFLFPVLFLLYFSLQARSLLNTTILFGLGAGVLLALWRDQFRLNLPAMTSLLLLAVLSAFFYGIEAAWPARGGTLALLLLGGWFQWKQILWFPPRFIALAAAAFGAVIFVRQGVYEELPVSILFLILTAVYFWFDLRENSS
jgi:hypothetical protein